ncbi:MAG: diguanylate cyclase [Candidatus Brocadia sp. AMX2]|uniref:Protein contains FOG: GAF domain n=1 Tax=Candidatus Brocadia sinica JPN1 TaxID=1197129 RepID=A0ABQ0JUH4_9BACT|nr:diguanylate cyclase [Candidatus Brocadia sinica]KAA0241004.1 MAG: diguanylate cyclase [Candidatus Brocadia sp. AMX2]MBL1170213.1 diguanylate cyclase [Candidatus Brocadia sp. AMX1]NOG41722.1 diguanylate cyclase [Planctomycetota bacterium]RIJ89305.1 MAG: GGDEF domain-containing protein [Candidatus Brocadia sp.]KXK25154.1 MAG: diguanylate cyclase/phosphodiesterase [Candidatus Brocadia sinica]
MSNQDKTKTEPQLENEETVTAERLTHAILDQAMEAIVVCDLNGLIIRTSKTARILCGRKPLLQPFETIFPIRFKREEKNYRNFRIADVLRGKDFRDVEVSLEYSPSARPGDIKVYNLLINASPLRNSENTVIGCIITLIDITESKRIKRRKSVLYATTQALAESDTFKEAIPKILQAICESLEWDLGAFWTVDRKTNVLNCAEIWHKPSVKVPEFEALTRQITFLSGIGLPGSVYASKKPLWITNVVSDANFPRAPVAAKEGLYGAFGFPILLGNHVLSVIEFFSHEIQPPDEDLLRMMAAIGGQIGQFIERKQSEDALRRRIDFEKTVANISTRFVTLSDFNNAVFKSLADAGRLSEASRAYLFQFRDNGKIMDNTHEWCDEGVASEIQHLQNLPAAMLPWLMENLHAGKVIHIADVSKMPPEAAAEKEEFKKQGIKAILILPVYAEKELAGFVGFDNVVAIDPWHEEDIALLRIMAEIIGNAIARRQSESRITHMAYHDTLTNLPNRNLFHDRLKVAIAHAKRNGGMVAVMILDLDHFKTINDSRGHHIGDLLLKAVAERLTRCVREGDTIARTGGDEFTIILPDLVHALNTIIVASKIIDALNQPFRLEGHEIHTTTSIGISLYPLDADDKEDLVKKADIAMYLSKARGKNTYRFYKSDMNAIFKQK